jgi:hypothetical protein
MPVAPSPQRGPEHRLPDAAATSWRSGSSVLYAASNKKAGAGPAFGERWLGDLGFEPRLTESESAIQTIYPQLFVCCLKQGYTKSSFGILSEWVEMPTGVVAQIMGHRPSAIAEEHYRRRPLDLLRQWHTKLEAWILEQAGIEQPAEAHAGLRVVS